jgi:type IV pilus assembly protein PilE
MKKPNRGFTLMEIMIVMVIVAILAAIAVPAYQDQIRSSRRSEAREALMQIQTAQERWRSNNTTYASSTSALDQPALSADANYALSVSGASASGYTATATARAKQASDSACSAITIVVAGNAMTYSPLTCWGR